MAKTVADGFLNDPRIAEARKLIQDALKEHQSKITQIKPANPELKETYEELLKKTSDYRGGGLYYKYLGSGIGNGPFVELADGSVKYDFITGIGVHYMGHSNPGVIDAQVKGSIGNTVMNGHLQQNTDTTKLLELLSTQACKSGANVKNVFLTSSGAMANENGFKLMFQKRAPATRMFSFEKCFSGRTLGMAWVTDKAAYRQGIPKTLDVDYIPFYDPNDHQGSIDKAVAVMKKYIYRYGAGAHAGIIMELIQGENGSWVGHTDFFMALINVCKENNISVMIDEVQTFGRTTELFAFQYFKLDKFVDVVSVGKNSQVCATLFNDDHKPKPGLMSQTFTGSSSQIAASYYVIKQILEGGALGPEGKNEKLHKHFKSHLEKLAAKYPDKVQGPYGVGAMVGMTLFKGDEPKSKEFAMKLFDNGVIAFLAGAHPLARLRFLMPVLMTETKHIDEVVAIIDKTLSEMN